MTEYQPGGRRRIDRVLAPGFADDVQALEGAELRSRRDDAEQEETDLSYVRRLLQGRLDLLRAEAERRAAGGEPSAPRTDAELVAQLKRVLTDSGSSGGGGGHRFVDAQPSRVGEHRREVEAIVADVEISDARHLDDAELAQATARLAELEQRVSRSRHEVQRVLDALDREVMSRVEAGTLPGDPSLPLG